MNTENLPQIKREPCRVRHSHTLRLHGSPADVFPLFCPVRELDWVPGWEIDWVISASGVAELHCMFQTPGNAGDGLPPSIWVVTRHDRERLELEMIKVTPGHTVIRLEAALEGDGEAGTLATVAYEYTAIGPRGEAFVARCDSAYFRQFMATWERTLNHFLDTGRKAA